MLKCFYVTLAPTFNARSKLAHHRSSPGKSMENYPQRYRQGRCLPRVPTSESALTQAASQPQRESSLNTSSSLDSHILNRPSIFDGDDISHLHIDDNKTRRTSPLAHGANISRQRVKGATQRPMLRRHKESIDEMVRTPLQRRPHRSAEEESNIDTVIDERYSSSPRFVISPAADDSSDYLNCSSPIANRLSDSSPSVSPQHPPTPINMNTENTLNPNTATTRRQRYINTKQRSTGYLESRKNSGLFDSFGASSSFDCASYPSIAAPLASTLPTALAASGITLSPTMTYRRNSVDSEPSKERRQASTPNLQSTNSKKANQVSAGKECPRPSRIYTGSRSAGRMSLSQSKNQPFSKSTPAISASSQAIITFCMDQAKADIAVRIVQRMAHARDDFAQFCANLTKEQWQDIVDSLKNFLNDVVKNLNSTDKISQISHRFGMHQVPKRNFGFKADFFSLMANALTTECVFLDAAAHQPTEAIEAWAELVGLMFTNVRDGYYEQVRQLRRASQNPCSPSASVGEPTFNENGYTSPKRVVPVRQGNRQRTSVEEG